jgi:hypothetical protein
MSLASGHAMCATWRPRSTSATDLKRSGASTRAVTIGRAGTTTEHGEPASAHAFSLPQRATTRHTPAPPDVHQRRVRSSPVRFQSGFYATRRVRSGMTGRAPAFVLRWPTLRHTSSYVSYDRTHQRCVRSLALPCVRSQIEWRHFCTIDWTHRSRVRSCVRSASVTTLTSPPSSPLLKCANLCTCVSIFSQTFSWVLALTRI